MALDRDPTDARQFALLLDDAASGTAATSVVSGWQTDTAFFRGTRRISWAKLSDDGVAYISLDALAGSPA